MQRRVIARLGSQTKRWGTSRHRRLSSLERRVIDATYTCSPAFSLLFTGARKILTRIGHSPRRGESAKIAAVEAGQATNSPLIAPFPTVHVNFAGETTGLSPNRQDDADT